MGEVHRELQVRLSPDHEMSLLLTIRGHWAGDQLAIRPMESETGGGGGPSSLFNRSSKGILLLEFENR